VLCCGFSAKHAFAPLYVVEINFKNAFFVEQHFQQIGQYKFLGFAPEVALTREKKIFGELLCDGRGTDKFRGGSALQREPIQAVFRDGVGVSLESAK